MGEGQLPDTRERPGGGAQETFRTGASGVRRQSGTRRATDLGRNHHQHPGQISGHLLGRRHRKSSARPAAGCGENRRQCARRFRADITRQPVLQGAALRFLRRPRQGTRISRAGAEGQPKRHRPELFHGGLPARTRRTCQGARIFQEGTECPGAPRPRGCGCGPQSGNPGRHQEDREKIIPAPWLASSLDNEASPHRATTAVVECPMLNERAQILLKTLVERYISDGQPVGSRALQQYSGLEISSATIRNVMADLEDIGLISSPHTSAGRIPTGMAYRLFIDTMLVTKPLDSARVQRMENQLQPDNPSRLIAQASNILSELTQFTGVVATSKRSTITVRQIEFLRLGEKRVLLIIVMPDGEVENRVLLLERDYTQSQLTEAANFLNQNYIGCSFSQIREKRRGELRQLHQDMSSLMAAALAAGDAAEAKQGRDYVISGEHNLLHVEDFSTDMGRLRGLFSLFEQKTELFQFLDAGRRGQGIHIFVGSESGLASLDECSVITAPYSADGQVIGTLAVVGPKRMDYQRVIPIVDITAKLLGNALSQN